MDEGLSLDNIFIGEDTDSALLEDNTADDKENIVEQEIQNKEGSAEDDQQVTEQINPESVGGESSKEGQEGTVDENATGSSQNNFYSSIASALKKDGILPDLSDENIKKIVEPEDFAKIFEDQIQNKLDEKQKRIDQALNYGVEPDTVSKYENTINYLNNITEDDINSEKDGEQLRKNLIYQDCVNRGWSKERAQKEVAKSIQAGTDIDDAKDALEGNRQFFQSSYDKIINSAKEQEEKLEEERKNQTQSLKKSIFDDKVLMGIEDIDKNTRTKILDNISKPVYRDEKTGEYYTALQKYQMDNKQDYIKNVGILYTLTDGFKNIDKLAKGKVQKEVRKGIRDLQNTINSTSRDSHGDLNFASGISDEDSFINSDWKLDV